MGAGGSMSMSDGVRGALSAQHTLVAALPEALNLDYRRGVAPASSTAHGGCRTSGVGVDGGGVGVTSSASDSDGGEDEKSAKLRRRLRKEGGIHAVARRARALRKRHCQCLTGTLAWPYSLMLLRQCT